MIGTRLVEELVQCVAISHRVKGQSRISVLLLAAPESGKTTISTAASCKHVCRIAVITGKSIMREMKDHPETEFLLFNDLSAVRALSPSAVALLIVLLNQFTQDEQGLVAFAGKDAEFIGRPVGVIACLPFETFVDHRSRWRELGFVSRMIPFTYSYDAELVAEIKDRIDADTHKASTAPTRTLPRLNKRPVTVRCSPEYVRQVRRIADARAVELAQLGIRLLKNYHCLVRAHALLVGRHHVTSEDIAFLREVDAYVSITESTPIGPSQKAKIAKAKRTTKVQSSRRRVVKTHRHK